MPIYEYECYDCGEISEVLQKFSDKPIRKCPACGGKVHKIMSMNSFHLKGDGWYVTDYKGKNSSTAAKGGEKHGKGEKTEKANKKNSKD